MTRYNMFTPYKCECGNVWSKVELIDWNDNLAPSTHCPVEECGVCGRRVQSVTKWQSVYERPMTFINLIDEMGVTHHLPLEHTMLMSPTYYTDHLGVPYFSGKSKPVWFEPCCVLSFRDNKGKIARMRATSNDDEHSFKVDGRVWEADEFSQFLKKCELKYVEEEE